MHLSKQQIAWLNAQPDQQTCSRCGRVGTKAYVQPQFDDRYGSTLCTDCICKINEEIRMHNKAQRDREPRCEAPGCNHRGAYYVGTGRVLLCGRHKNAVFSASYRAGVGSPLGLFTPMDSGKAAVMGMLTGRHSGALL